MSPKEALLYHLVNVFPILDGLTLGFFFTWKAVMFIFCSYLAWRNPLNYFWAALMMFSLLPNFLLVDNSDIVSKLVHLYLLWMCGEVTFRSLAVDSEARILGWWMFGVAAIFLL